MTFNLTQPGELCFNKQRREFEDMTGARWRDLAGFFSTQLLTEQERLYVLFSCKVKYSWIKVGAEKCFKVTFRRVVSSHFVVDPGPQRNNLTCTQIRPRCAPHHF